MTTIKNLAENAYVKNEDDYGTSRQIDAQNLFYSEISTRWPEEFSDSHSNDFSTFALKGTSNENIDYALEILGYRQHLAARLDADTVSKICEISGFVYGSPSHLLTLIPVDNGYLVSKGNNLHSIYEEFIQVSTSAHYDNPDLNLDKGPLWFKDIVSADEFILPFLNDVDFIPVCFPDYDQISPSLK